MRYVVLLCAFLLACGRPVPEIIDEPDMAADMYVEPTYEYCELYADKTVITINGEAFTGPDPDCRSKQVDGGDKLFIVDKFSSVISFPYSNITTETKCPVRILGIIKTYSTLPVITMVVSGRYIIPLKPVRECAFYTNTVMISKEKDRCFVTSYINSTC